VPNTGSMRNYIRHWPQALILLVAALLVACGSSATATPVSSGGAEPTATSGSAPTAMPGATKEAPGMVKRGGTITMGQKETGIFEGHPGLSSSPRIQFVNSSVGEGLITAAPDFSASPMLAESWSVSEDFKTWSWKFQEGVQFHKGYGEMTAEDVFYSYMQWHEGAKHARAGIIGEYFDYPNVVGRPGDLDADGNVKQRGGKDLYPSTGTTITGPYTMEVDTGKPWVPGQMFAFMRTAGGSSTWVVSKKQSEEIGIEAASKDIAATGPWEIQDSESGVSWEFSAVQDHWRQTPYFDELVYWSIPEESARVAGFQTGVLDSFDMAFDSLPTVDATEGSQILDFPNAGQAGLNLYGQMYGLDKDGKEYEHYDCTNPWVSCDMDTESAAWAKAVKVRKAMNISIDRQTIVDTLLSGYGRPLAVRDWMGHDSHMKDSWVYEYDPVLAKQMLDEAGYPDGFSITLTPSIRGAVAETEACEAVAQYWQAIGIKVDFKNTPYSALRPSFINRSYIGATCHTVGVRLSPVEGMSNYMVNSTFAYGTFHPWLEEHIGSAAEEVDPEKAWVKNTEITDWLFENSAASALYIHNTIWPVGKKLDANGWVPLDWSEVRTAVNFESVKPR